MDSDQIAEVAAIEILGNVLEHIRTLAILSHDEQNCIHPGGFQKLPHTAKLVLQTYANDRETEGALAALENMRISSNESASDYCRRLAAAG